MSIKAINPYLTFNGSGQEAIAFYEKALGAEVIDSMSYGEMKGMDIPEGAESLILHAYLKIGGMDIMLSDSLPGNEETSGSLVSIALFFEDTSSAEQAFHALEPGGEILMPLQGTFFSPAYGQVKDSFGVLWHVSAAGENK
ncbi:VOC family protein [Sinobaca sp. H24]|uniref:VOC family protein n=1 Tax=Sinobaca sp. H24 TaxID=2923376 RepID=UPI00207AF87F|nr:VOC family protein [Sinobaca sp. H24]